MRERFSQQSRPGIEKRTRKKYEEIHQEVLREANQKDENNETKELARGQQ